MIENAIYSLLQDTTINVYVSDRVYPLQIPQNDSLPAITYQRIYTDRIRALNADTNMVMARFQITIFSYNFFEMKNIFDAVRTKLQRYNGTVSSVVIDDIKIEDELDLKNDDETYQCVVDIYITYRE